MSVFVASCLVACASGEDGGDESATPTTGDPVTTLSSSFTSDPTLSTTEDPTDTTTTTEAADSSSTSGTGDVPAECPVGTLDCPCDTKGGCTDDLACVEDVCVAAVCDEDLGEPNDFRVDAIELGAISDDDVETLELEGVLDGTGDGAADEDWFTYQGGDDVGETVDPGLLLTVESGMVEVCQFFACNNGDPQVVCPAGTNGVVEGGINGCCGTSGFQFGPDDVECVAGAFDTSGTVWIVVRNGSQQCVSYSGTAHF